MSKLIPSSTVLQALLFGTQEEQQSLDKYIVNATAVALKDILGAFGAKKGKNKDESVASYNEKIQSLRERLGRYRQDILSTGKLPELYAYYFSAGPRPDWLDAYSAKETTVAMQPQAVVEEEKAPVPEPPKVVKVVVKRPASPERKRTVDKISGGIPVPLAVQNYQLNQSLASMTEDELILLQLAIDYILVHIAEVDSSRFAVKVQKASLHNEVPLYDYKSLVSTLTSISTKLQALGSRDAIVQTLQQILSDIQVEKRVRAAPAPIMDVVEITEQPVAVIAEEMLIREEIPQTEVAPVVEDPVPVVHEAPAFSDELLQACSARGMEVARNSNPFDVISLLLIKMDTLTTQYQTELTQKDQDIAALQVQLAELANIKTQHSALDQLRANMEREHNLRQNEIAELRSNIIPSLQAQLAEAKEERASKAIIAAKEQEVENMKRLLAEVQDSKTQLEAHVATLDRKLEESTVASLPSVACYKAGSGNVDALSNCGDDTCNIVTGICQPAKPTDKQIAVNGKNFTFNDEGSQQAYLAMVDDVKQMTQQIAAASEPQEEEKRPLPSPKRIAIPSAAQKPAPAQTPLGQKLQDALKADFRGINRTNIGGQSMSTILQKTNSLIGNRIKMQQTGGSVFDRKYK